MIAYVVRRALVAVLLVFAVSSASLVLTRLAPGDFVTESLGTHASREAMERPAMIASVGAVSCHSSTIHAPDATRLKRVKPPASKRLSGPALTKLKAISRSSEVF